MMKKKIWNYLRSAGMTEAGAAGLMGNLQAESRLTPNKVEDICLKYMAEAGRHYTDATYTALVDDGTISMSEFLHPFPYKQYGYGLAQWTSPDRKAGLYTLAKARKTSIGDLGTQLEWLITELKDGYPSVWKALSTTDSVYNAACIVLSEFEQPTDTGMTVRTQRYQLALSIYDEMTEGSDSMTSAQELIAIMRGWLGYSEADGSYRIIIDKYNEYGAKHGYPRGYRVQYGDAWCDVTVSAAFIEADAVDLIGGIECGVEEHIKIFKAKGIWVEDGAITPKPGDIICYNWDKSSQPNDGYADHIGIVESVEGNRITVIEGNCNSAVQRRTIPVGWGYIRGFAKPAYGNAQGAVDPDPAPASGSGIVGTCSVTLKQFLPGAVDPQVKTIQVILNSLGYSGKDGNILAVDGDLGPNTAYAIERFQRDKGMKDINFGSVAVKTWRYLLNAD